MLVNEIFSSIEGEGIRMGFPVTFIRLYGCNLKCSYCDTRYSCEGDNYDEMSIPEIEEKVQEFGIKRITITGGEPLLQYKIENLIEYLLDRDYEINIETNGSINIFKYSLKEKVIITMDYKSVSSGQNDSMNEFNFLKLRSHDVLKFVVGSKEDLDGVQDIIDRFRPTCNIFVSPVFGKITLQEIVEYIKVNQLHEVRVQAQLHKIIWPIDMRGV